MKLHTSLIATFLLLTSCASRMNPHGRDFVLGTDTTGYVAASGNARITSPDGSSISGDKLLIVGDENQSKSFKEGSELVKTASRWYFGMGAVKSLGNVAGNALKSKEVTTRALSKNDASVKINDSNNAAAIEKAKLEVPEETVPVE